MAAMPSMTAQRTWPGAPPASAAPGAAAESILPFDYGAEFAIEGKPGRVVQSAISVGSEGVFVAVAIGYGFEEDRAGVLELTKAREGVVPVKDILLSELPVDALLTGFRVDPALRLLSSSGASASSWPDSLSVASDHADLILDRVRPPTPLSFLFSMVDTSTGRELQDEPTFSVASLGSSDGRRPFRMLPHPLTFLPRSTVRMQVIERTADVKGALFIVLYGYKLLAEGCGEDVVRSLRGRPDCPVETVGRPSTNVVPFDYVGTLDLAGTPGRLATAEIPIAADGGFVATSLGYALALPSASDVLRVDEADESVDLQRDVKLGHFAWDAITVGVRIRPEYVRLAFDNGGTLASPTPAIAKQLFESLNQPNDVSFRYAITDMGSGRELQNQPLNNIAGLGIANGDRPFKKFARALVFRPRSTIRIAVIEHFGRGRLYFVFQGYKLVGGGGR